MMPSPYPETFTSSDKAQWSDFSVSLVVFISLIATSAFGQYIFYTAHISPAVIWPPAGIALAAILKRGYRMWIPIACASFVASLISPSQPVILVILGSTFAQTLSAVGGAYLLEHMGFKGSFGTMREAIIFSGTALVIAAIAPTITVGAQLLSHTLSDGLYVSWSRSWAGRVLSIMILTPLLELWIPRRAFFFNNTKGKIEAVCLFGGLTILTGLLFWTPLAQTFSFLLLLGFLVNLFWIALRLNVRSMVLALFLITTLGMAGPILVPSTVATPLNQRLFSVELFIILIGPVFLAVCALMKERREGSRLLQEHILQLEEAMRRLNSEDEAKNEFIAILAHELRNPLAAILSSTELLKLQEVGKSESSGLLGTIDNRVRAMARLLDDLLDTSRVSQKQFKLEKETVALAPIIERSVETAHVLLYGRNHKLSVVQSDEDLYVDADPVRLEQIIVNLLSNAAKYTEPRGTIELKSVREGSSVVISVRDNGIGIPKNMLTRIFEPFFQIEHGKRVGAGLGIGLSLTRRLVELHDGMISASSEGENRGSEFVLRLPLSTSGLPSARTETKTLRGGRRLRAAKHARRILVVDDNEAAAGALAQLLSLRGHDVVTAGSGAQALEKASEFDPEVVLLDIGLPDMDGYQVARKLKRNQENPPLLIAITGYGQSEDKKRALDAGFERHLTKPVGLKEIEVALRSLSSSSFSQTDNIPVSDSIKEDEALVA